MPDRLEKYPAAVGFSAAGMRDRLGWGVSRLSRAQLREEHYIDYHVVAALQMLFAACRCHDCNANRRPTRIAPCENNRSFT